MYGIDPRKPTGSRLLLASLVSACLSAAASENDWFVRLEQPRVKAPRKSINSAETVDEYPGPPVVPQRQSERKKPPAPDYLLGKVIWGQSASFTSSSGKRHPIADWNLVTVDAHLFVRQLRAVGLAYHWANVNLNEFSFNPKRMPSLLFSGVRTLKLDPSHIKKLRQYVLKGGMVICDSVYGSPFFYESAKETFQGAFPEERFRVLPKDHPIFHIFHSVEEVVYPPGEGTTAPYLEGLYVGSRVGILLSKYGLGTGWHGDQRIMTYLAKRGLKPLYYDVDSARKMGLNLAGYIVGYADAGEIEGRPELFGLPDQKRPTDEFVFAQIRHNGAWNVHPGAASALMMKLRRQSSIRLNLKRVVVDPGKDALSLYPFLYLTGLDDFSFSEREVAALRSYIEEGGVLLINNGLGLATFHQAVKRELARVLPEVELKPIPLGHDLFRSFASVTAVNYSPALRKDQPELGTQPALLGVTFDDELRVIYSPYDLEAGWLDAYYPLMRGYENRSAQELGMNLIAYVITH